MRHRDRIKRRKQAKQLGALAPLIIVSELPENLLQIVAASWPQGRMTRAKVETFVRHNMTNYDTVRFHLHRQRYDELRQAADGKIASALDAWIEAHPDRARVSGITKS